MGIVNAWRRLRIWYYQIKWLNMSRKTDKKRARHVDIILLSEIITDSMYWQRNLTFLQTKLLCN